MLNDYEEIFLIVHNAFAFCRVTFSQFPFHWRHAKENVYAFLVQYNKWDYKNCDKICIMTFAGFMGNESRKGFDHTFNVKTRKKSKSKNGYKLSCCERVSNDAIEEARGRLNEYWNVIKETDLWKMTQNICYEVCIKIITYTSLRSIYPMFSRIKAIGFKFLW